jgi:hypothetical protein
MAAIALTLLRLQFVYKILSKQWASQDTFGDI